MSDYSFTLTLGTHLSEQELTKAAELLSLSYTRWQNNPKNTNPVKTDTSPPVYARMMRKGIREVVLYYEGEVLCGVFCHSLSPQFDQYPLRKLSYLAVTPEEKGFDALKTAFRRYAEFAASQGEDVVITTDLDQGTLNALLESAGFRECEDRNETYFILGQLLFRKLISSQKVAGDFVIDEIIKCDGKAIRRCKKLYVLQNTPFNFYDLYRQQQLKRLSRSIPDANRALLAEALAHPDEGIFFVCGYNGAVTNPDEERGGFDSKLAVLGKGWRELLPEINDPADGLSYLLPASLSEFPAIGSRTVPRLGFFDFLSYCYKILGSFFVASSAPRPEVLAALDRSLHPDLQLKFADLIESVLAPEVLPVPGKSKTLSDGSTRTGFRLAGPFVEQTVMGPHVRMDRMLDSILSLRLANRAPIVYLASELGHGSALTRLAEEARKGAVVLVLDFGTDLTRFVNETLKQGDPADTPSLSAVSIRDFYQVPVMLEALGLRTERGIDLNLAVAGMAGATAGADEIADRIEGLR